HLEPDPRPEGEEQTDGGGALRQLTDLWKSLEGVHRIDRGDVDVGSRIREYPEVEDDEDEDLADQGNAQDPRGELDVEVGEDRDQRHHEQCEIGPSDVRAGQVEA